MKKSQGGAPAPLQIPISHADKVFWPNEGYTKLNLAEYYNAIFPELLPYIKDRMLALERCPDGMLANASFKSRNRGTCLPAPRPNASSMAPLPAGSLITWLAARW